MNDTNKKIWIVNEYAMPPQYEFRIRNNMMAKCLRQDGYDVTIIGGTFLHGFNKQLFKKNFGFLEKYYDEQRFIHIAIPSYQGNGFKRVIAMLWFQWSLFLFSKKIAEQIGVPDIILYDDWAIPLCPARKISDNFNAILIPEVRDLYPESFVAYGYLRKKSLLAKYLYKLEHEFYYASDAIVFSLEGGKDYIVDKGWVKLGGQGKSIDLNKVYTISNGLDLELFYENMKAHKIQQPELSDETIFKVVYTGSIRKANEVDKLVEIAQELRKMERTDICIFVYGDGDQREKISKKVVEIGLKNIKFMGKVAKQEIPSVLSQCNAAIYILKESSLLKYGESLNKSYEYLAAGLPVIVCRSPKYSIVEHYKCGICLKKFTAKDAALSIIKLADMGKDEYENLCNNAKNASKKYDFKYLTNKLIDVIDITQNRIIMAKKEYRKN